MKLYTIIGGINGCGKSSFSGVLHALVSNLGETARGRDALSQIEQWIGEGLSFTQETTLIGGRNLQTIRRAKEAGYTIRLYYIALSSAAECVRRIRSRAQRGGHDVLEEDVQRRFAERIPALVRVLPLCDEAVLFDNENGFVAVGKWKDGALTPLTDHPPDWFQELQSAL